ncbi:MZM1 [Candida metapsilosis]|uniref:Mitochondrial zinc maintenance protein 1, mitochondrial n=1 Tax=Candida metapsilosis TaxID=273372 RepID=A0A8H7ZG22_9ASCO|nr:MZM1 [Candida metapsilosis]
MSTTKAAYKQALKAVNFVFKNDAPILNAAKQQIKQQIYANQHLTNKTELDDAITKLNEVSKFLVQNIVQGELNENGRYFLKFHEKTELGDNETIKQSKKEMGSLSGAKGSSIRAKKCGE